MTTKSNTRAPGAEEPSGDDQVKGYEFINLEPAIAAAAGKLGFLAPPQPAGGRNMSTLGSASADKRSN